MDILGRILLSGFSLLLMALQIYVAILVITKPESSRARCLVFLIAGLVFSLINILKGPGSIILTVDSIFASLLITMMALRIAETKRGIP